MRIIVGCVHLLVGPWKYTVGANILRRMELAPSCVRTLKDRCMTKSSRQQLRRRHVFHPLTQKLSSYLVQYSSAKEFECNGALVCLQVCALVFIDVGMQRI
jgi:hypothetical protein